EPAGSGRPLDLAEGRLRSGPRLHSAVYPGRNAAHVHRQPAAAADERTAAANADVVLSGRAATLPPGIVEHQLDSFPPDNAEAAASKVRAGARTSQVFAPLRWTGFQLDQQRIRRPPWSEWELTGSP